MSNLNFTRLIRAVERAIQIGRRATDAALKAAAPVLEGDYVAFQDSDKTVELVANEEQDKRTARERMVEVFSKVYEKIRSSILFRKPQAELPERASAMLTPDDLVNASRKVVILLMKLAGVDETHPIDGKGEAAPTGEPWALDLLRELLDALAVAERDLNDCTVAGQLLHQATENRAEKRQALDARFVAFRRLVRIVYGRRSPEYRSLRERGQPDEPVQPPAPTPVPPPTSTPA